MLVSLFQIVLFVGYIAIPAYRPIHHRQRFILDDEVFVHLDLGADALAVGTHAQRRVEAEQLRRQVGKADAAVGTGVVFAENQLFVAQVGNQNPVARLECGFHGIHQSPQKRFIGVFRHDKPVDDQFDGVLGLFIEFGRLLREIDQFAVDTGAHVAVLFGLGEGVGVGAFAVAGEGRQQLELGAAGQGGQLVGDHLGGLGLDDTAAVGAVGRAYPRKQNAQVIHHLGDGADGGTRVLADRFLLDGDGGAEAADVVHFGFFHLPQELPRIGREAFDVAPLPFGVDGVEGEGGFAAAADAGEDD